MQMTVISLLYVCLKQQGKEEAATPQRTGHRNCRFVPKLPS